MKNKKIIALFLMFMLVFLSINIITLAQEESEEPEESPLECEKVASIGGRITCSVKTFFSGLVIKIRDTLVDLLTDLINFKPPNKGYEKLWNIIVYISMPIIALLVTLTSFKFFKGSADPAERALAKKQATNLLYMMIFLVASPLIISLILDFFDILTTSIGQVLTPLSGLASTVLATAVVGIGYLPFLLVFAALAFSFIVVAIIRQLILIILISIFPLIIILYFYGPTKYIGDKLLKVLIANITIPLVWTVVFSIGFTISSKVFFIAGIIPWLTFPINAYLYFVWTKLISASSYGQQVVPKTSTAIKTVIKYMPK